MDTRRSKYGGTQEAPGEIFTAILRSGDLLCSVCLEVVFDKENIKERYFGILPNCSHCYCVKCIRTWWSVKSPDGKAVQSCPVCRTRSPFYIPSKYWVDDTEDKQKLVQKHRDLLRTKLCPNFHRGRGKCRFGSRCFYKHVLDDKPVE